MNVSAIGRQIKRNAGNITKVVFFCASLGYLVKFCGYDANEIAIGSLVGMGAFFIGDLADSLFREANN